MPGPILILSDLHLGCPHRAALGIDALRPLWRDAAHVVINGDLAEVHHPRYRGDAARAVLALADACDADGVGLTLLSGNHDPLISDQRHLHLAGGHILVTHGDAIHPSIAPWSVAGPRLAEAHRAALARLSDDERQDLEARLSASQYASQAEWEAIESVERETAHGTLAWALRHPEVVAKVFWYWHRFPRLAARFATAHAPDARIVVIGHTHRAGVWHVGGRTVINTGSFGFPGRPHAVLAEGRTLRYVRIEQRGSRYQFASGGRTLALPMPVDEAAAALAPVRGFSRTASSTA